MKYLEKLQVEHNTKIVTVIQQNNLKVLKETEAKLHTVFPPELQELILELNLQIGRISIMSHARFNAFHPEVDLDSTNVAYVYAQNNTPYPTLDLYHEELAQLAQKLEIKGAKLLNLRRIGTYFEKRFDMEVPMEFRDFVLNVLPVNLPSRVFFDGSYSRVSLLAKKPEAELYGVCSDENIFAVKYIFHNEPCITFFLKEIDPYKELALKIANIANIDFEKAWEISKRIPQNTYYRINPEVFHDFMQFAVEMASILNVKEGCIVYDNFQGDVEVVLDTFTNQLALNIDDEIISVVIAKGVIYIYEPAND